MRSLLTLTLIILCLNIYSQKDSSIYTSDFEKQIFTKLNDSLPVRPMDLLLAFQYSSNSPEIEKSILSFAGNMEAKGIGKLNRKKQIKEIYNQVHERFLKKYEEGASFKDIFQNGSFNCASASALYAVFLDYFKIDYQIKEKPDHVFIIADPSGTSFMIETTLPSRGVFQFDEKFKKAYVDYLHNNKLISETEFNSKSTDLLFQEHFESAKTINLKQLAGIQYFNQGVFFYNAKDYEKAANNLEKANIIYPSSTIQFLYSNALSSLIVEQTGKKKYNGLTLAKYLNLNHTNHETLQMTKDHFTSISNEMVINRPDITGYSRFYNDFISNTSDSIDTNDFSQTYHEIMAYHYYLKKNFQKVLHHATGAYKINPENIRTQQFVLEALVKYLHNDEADDVNFDTINNYITTFPFLLQHELFQQVVAYGLTENIQDKIVNPVSQEFRECMKAMNNYCLKLKTNSESDFIIEAIYSEAASGLVRSYNYDGAEELLRNGLQIIPGSERLSNQLKTISASKKDLQKYIRNTNIVINNSTLIKPPAYNDTEVYAVLKKYMTKCWNVDYFKKDGKSKEPKVEQLKFIFLADNKMKFRTGTEEHWGTWKLNESGPTLILKSNEDQQQFTILIYEASSTQMRGIVSPYKTDNKKIEFNVCDK